MRHVIEVDDWIWSWAQRQTGQVKPAGYLRAVLGEAIHKETERRVRKEMMAAVRDDIRNARSKEKK